MSRSSNASNAPGQRSGTGAYIPEACHEIRQSVLRAGCSAVEGLSIYCMGCANKKLLLPSPLERAPLPLSEGGLGFHSVQRLHRLSDSCLAGAPAWGFLALGFSPCTQQAMSLPLAHYRSGLTA